jgi:hypothetical protein
MCMCYMHFINEEILLFFSIIKFKVAPPRVYIHVYSPIALHYDQRNEDINIIIANGYS